MTTENKDYAAVLDRIIDYEAEEAIMKYFRYGHLKHPEARKMSSLFTALAFEVMTAPRSAERAVALRKLLEGKDAAVRAILD